MLECMFLKELSKFKWILDCLNYIKKILIFKLVKDTIYQKDLQDKKDNKEVNKIEGERMKEDQDKEDNIENLDKINKVEEEDEDKTIRIDKKEDKDNMNSIEEDQEDLDNKELLQKEFVVIQDKDKLKDKDKIGQLDKIDKLNTKEEIPVIINNDKDLIDILIEIKILRIEGLKDLTDPIVIHKIKIILIKETKIKIIVKANHNNHNKSNNLIIKKNKKGHYYLLI